MATSADLADALQPLLPLRIRAVEYNDPMLVVVGDGWSLAISAPWTWRREEGLAVGWGEPATGDAVWDLCGLSIAEVLRTATPRNGIALVLSDGAGVLEITADRGWEPWTFQHRDLPVVLVGHGT